MKLIVIIAIYEDSVPFVVTKPFPVRECAPERPARNPLSTITVFTSLLKTRGGHERTHSALTTKDTPRIPLSVATPAGQRVS